MAACYLLSVPTAAAPLLLPLLGDFTTRSQALSSAMHIATTLLHHMPLEGALPRDAATETPAPPAVETARRANKAARDGSADASKTYEGRGHFFEEGTRGNSPRVWPRVCPVPLSIPIY